MREILFRGKGIKHPNVGEWVEGYYVHNLSGSRRKSGRRVRAIPPKIPIQKRSMGNEIV